MNFLHGRSVLVLGLGESGLAMARWCVRCGAAVQVWDSREQPPHADTLRTELPQARLFGGALGSALPEGVQLLLKSPGLGPHDPRIAPLLQATRAAGIAVMAELDLFVQALADLRAAAPVDAPYAPQLLAITGTNGKTTTTALTTLLVERAGRVAAAAGNIMPTMLDRLTSMLDGAREDWVQVWVLELSSFQLADAGAVATAPAGAGAVVFEPAAAAVLNVSQDHLDWHGSLEAYVAAKARIFGREAVMVVNRDDPRVEALVPQPVVLRGGRGRPVVQQRRVQRFGLDAPQRPGDFGLVVDNGMAWLVRALPVDETQRKGRSREDDEIHLQRLMPADALRIRGRHNAANALAALALATAIGCPLAPMLHGLREYAGEPHRVEFVGSVGGVEAFDDSKGTNVGATVAAIEGLGADKAPGKLVVILGGDGKGQDFAPLARPVHAHARAVALVGRDAGSIQQALRDTGVAQQQHATLEAAVAWCFEQAQPRDAVLLSPACASLDMFRNYGHRAQVFVDAVRALAADRGEAV